MVDSLAFSDSIEFPAAYFLGSIGRPTATISMITMQARRRRDIPVTPQPKRAARSTTGVRPIRLLGRG
ncbi:MAG: hypothetical protein H7252_04985 [Cytophaga sp.]|nr:hypothetical protein [Undibacterium sp.]